MSATDAVPRRPSRDALALALLFLLTFVPRIVDLGSDPPNNLSIDSGSEYGDPGNYAFNARSKVVTGRWRIEELGAAAFSPIPHILTLALFRLFGPGIWQMNLVALTFAMLLWLALLRLSSVWFRDVRLLFFALLALNYAFGSYARINDQVMPMTLFSVIALIFFLKGWDRPRCFFFTGLCLGLSFISKAKMIYFSGGVIPLAFVLITIQRGELKKIRRHAVRIGWALAGGLIVFVPWFLVFRRHLKVFGSVASINSTAATPRALGGLIKNWIVRPPLTFFSANAALSVLLFLYAFGLLAIVSSRRWRTKLPPLEIVLILWFGIGVGINSFIGYRPVRHYMELTIPLLFLSALVVRRITRGVSLALPRRGRAGFLAGAFVLLWIALSANKHGVLSWGLIPRDPLNVLIVSLAAAAGITLLLAIALRVAGERVLRVPRAAGVALAAIVLGVYGWQNVAGYVTWRESVSYDLRDIGRDLGRAFPHGVFSGLLIPTLSLENKNPAHTMFPRYANDDPGFLAREGITHIFLGSYNNERQFYDNLFPDVMARARLLVVYRMWRSWWMLYDIREGLPPEDPAVHEAETMERSTGRPVFEPGASGRFAVRVVAPEWGVIGMDKIGLPVRGRVHGLVFVKPEAGAPPGATLVLRLSLKGKSVLKTRLDVPRETPGGGYVGLPFDAWIETPGNYLLEIKAAGTGAFLFDRVEIRPGPGA